MWNGSCVLSAACRTAGVLGACRQWLEEKARNRFLEQRHAEAGIYEIEVKTGRMKVRVRRKLREQHADW